MRVSERPGGADEREEERPAQVGAEVHAGDFLAVALEGELVMRLRHGLQARHGFGLRRRERRREQRRRARCASTWHDACRSQQPCARSASTCVRVANRTRIAAVNRSFFSRFSTAMLMLSTPVRIVGSGTG